MQCSIIEDYAKWHLLYSRYFAYTASLPEDDWEIFRDIKLPKTSNFNDETKACVEYLEDAMPLAVARPFVEEFITDSMKDKVKPSKVTNLNVYNQCVYILQVGAVAEQIKTAFKQRIEEKDWLDQITKNRTKEKVINNKLVIIYGHNFDYAIKTLSMEF